MKISRRQQDGVSILELAGKLTIGTGDFALHDAVRDVLNDGARAIVLNLQRVTTIDSAGVGELVSAYTTSAQRNARVKLAVLPPKVQDVLLVTQLLTVFEVFDDEAAAVASFR